jgi:hypothetical protein
MGKQCHDTVGKIFVPFQIIVYHNLFPNIYLQKHIFNTAYGEMYYNEKGFTRVGWAA